MIETLKIEDIKEHPLNSKIYGNIETDDLEASITEAGLLNPIVVADTPDGFVVVSGHRRLQAMRNLGFEEVPAEYTDSTTFDEIITEMITQNLYRVKTNEILIREGLALEEAEKERAKDRMGRNSEKLGAVRDLIGEKLGMSGKTYDEGRKVIQTIDELEEAGDHDGADNLRHYLDQGIHTAARAISEDDPKPKPERDDPQISKHNYWPVLSSVISHLEKAYKKLQPTRDHTAIPGYGDMVGNLMDIRDRLKTWDPKYVEENGAGLSRPSDY